MNKKKQHGDRFARTFPSPHYGYVGCGTIIGCDLDEALQIQAEDVEIEIGEETKEEGDTE